LYHRYKRPELAVALHWNKIISRRPMMSEARTRDGGVHCITVLALMMEMPTNFMAPVGRAVVSIAQRGFKKLICL
jgi:hypothetical protein